MYDEDLSLIEILFIPKITFCFNQSLLIKINKPKEKMYLDATDNASLSLNTIENVIAKNNDIIICKK